MYIGIDDTDSDKGMCTTYLALELVKEFDGALDLIGHPRLVRLNPNIPWKTRGNGAICLRVGKGTGERKIIGEVDGRPVHIWSNERRSEVPLKREQVLAKAVEVVERHSHLDADGTNSAIVVLDRKPSVGLYWKTVRDVVSIKEARATLPRDNLVRSYKNGRGIVGASAAIAWRPRDRTFEVLVYRARDRWGTKREVNLADAKALDNRYPSTFNNYDHRNEHAAIVPGSPCPILFGIRGDDPEVLPQAIKSIRSEPKDRWVIFETNQGTDDHMPIRNDLQTYQSGIMKGTITRAPKDIKGGHVLFGFRVLPSGPHYQCAAYEPTKEFRTIIRSLICDDRVALYASRGSAHPETVSMEKIRVIRLVDLQVKSQNPRCPSCKRSMKSSGHGQGYRCRRCGTRREGHEAHFESMPRTLIEGCTYEVPICARRHLSKPLKRITDGP